MNEEKTKKLKFLMGTYSKRIGSYADFGSDLWFIDLERNRRYKKITESSYMDMGNLGKCVHVEREKDGNKKTIITDKKELEKILNSAYEPSLSIFEKITSLKETAANYSKKINSYADFGSELWEIDLERSRRNGVVSAEEYNKIKLFAKENLELIGIGQNAIDKRWEILCRWVDTVAKTDATLNKNLFSYKYSKETPYFNENEYDAFKQKLEKEWQNGAISDRMYAVLFLAFDDTDKFMQKSKQDAEKEFLAEMSIKEKMQKAKGRTVLISLLIIIFEPLPFCLIAQNLLVGIGVWGLCSPVAIPLAFTIAMLVSDRIAEATVGLNEYEQSDEYKAMKAATKAGFIVGGISAGIGCLKELKKPGWTKDSKRV